MRTAPGRIVPPHGMPEYGKFCGLAREFNWHELTGVHARSARWRRFHHKRWHYAALATDDLFCGMAIVDVGWTNTAFAYAFDRRAARVVAAYSRDGLPGLTAQVARHADEVSRFRFLGQRIDIGPHGMQLRCGDFAIDAAFAGEAPLLLAVGPVAGGAVHATQKSGALALSGEVRIGGQRYALDGGVASYDYSNGLLARETDWRWASAHSPQIGFNLQAGYFGQHENALWLDGALVPLGAAQFDFDAADPLAPWHVRTDDGLLELRFMPEGARREDKDLLIAASRYVQPIGVFDGFVRAQADAPRRAVTRLVGVTEDHRSRW